MQRIHLAAELTQAAVPWKEWHGEYSIKWTPIVSLETKVESTRLNLGLSSNGWWTKEHDQSAKEFSPGTNCLFLLPILEFAAVDVRKRLLDGLKDRGLSEEFLELFPFEDIICTALEGHSDYWGALALVWAKNFVHLPRIEQAIKSMKDCGPTQKLRHKARSLLRSRDIKF